MEHWIDGLAKAAAGGLSRRCDAIGKRDCGFETVPNRPPLASPLSSGLGVIRGKRRALVGGARAKSYAGRGRAALESARKRRSRG